jgi:hypothetical protein
MAKRNKQAMIPGSEELCFPDLDEAMNIYHGVKTERQELTEREVDTKAEVTRLMKEHKLKSYKSLAYDLIATRDTVTDDKTSVKRVPGSNGEAE